MDLQTSDLDDIQRLKTLQRRTDAENIASGKVSAQDVQAQNSWFSESAPKRILNSKEVAQRIIASL